jgi:uncharacterized membrane protein (DUF4010 family)
MPLDLFQRLAVALAIGFAVGVERGWRDREGVEGSRTAGIRTYTLTGLLGGVSGLLAQTLGAWALAAVLVPYAAAFAVFKLREARAEKTYSVTSVVAALLVFALGAYAVIGDWRLASAAAVAALALLAFRTVLHDWLRTLSWEELRSALILLAMTLIILPLLPDKDLGPYGVFNPYQLWMLTIALGGVSFLGYLAIRVLGAGKGALVAAAVGALISSTAVVLDLARRAAKTPGLARVAVAGGLLAGAVMAARVLLVAAALSAPLALRLAPPLAAFALVSALIAAAAAWRAREPAVKGEGLRNPLELKAVLQFAAVLAVITAAAQVAGQVYGPRSLLVVAALAGLADVDAMTLTAGRMTAHQGLAVSFAAGAVLIAVAANSLVKAAIAFFVGGPRFGIGYAAGGFVAAAAAAAAFLLRP